QVVRRTNCDVIDPAAAAAHSVEVAVKLLELGKEFRVGEMTVHHTNRVVRIIGNREPAARIRHRPHVPRRDISGRANQSVGLHQTSLLETSDLLQPSYRTQGDSIVTPKRTFSRRSVDRRTSFKPRR